MKRVFFELLKLARKGPENGHFLGFLRFRGLLLAKNSLSSAELSARTASRLPLESVCATARLRRLPPPKGGPQGRRSA